jgi:replication-associated recombination protein RarA
MKAAGYGQGYRYPHDEEKGYAAGVRYLPEQVNLNSAVESRSEYV